MDVGFWQWLWMGCGWAVDGSSPYIQDRCCVRHDICVGARQRQRKVFDRNGAVLLECVSLLDMRLVRCEEAVPYCRKLRDVIANVGVTEIPAEVHLTLRYFKWPYTTLHSFGGGRLCSSVLDVKLQQPTFARNALLAGLHNVELFSVPSVERRKYHASVEETWPD